MTLGKFLISLSALSISLNFRATFWIKSSLLTSVTNEINARITNEFTARITSDATLASTDVNKTANTHLRRL
jgi:hypothetical protein